MRRRRHWRWFLTFWCCFSCVKFVFLWKFNENDDEMAAKWVEEMLKSFNSSSCVSKMNQNTSNFFQRASRLHEFIKKKKKFSMKIPRANVVFQFQFLINLQMTNEWHSHSAGFNLIFTCLSWKLSKTFEFVALFSCRSFFRLFSFFSVQLTLY